MIISYPHLNQYYTYEPTLTESQYNSFNLNLKWKLMRFNCLGLYVYISLQSFLFLQVYIFNYKQLIQLVYTTIQYNK